MIFFNHILELKIYNLHYIDTDSFVLSINTKNIIQDLHNLKDYFDFSNLNEDHELFSNVNKKLLGKFKIETPKNIFIDEFIALTNRRLIGLNVIIIMKIKIN